MGTWQFSFLHDGEGIMVFAYIGMFEASCFG